MKVTKRVRTPASGLDSETAKDGSSLPDNHLLNLEVQNIHFSSLRYWAMTAESIERQRRIKKAFL